MPSIVDEGLEATHRVYTFNVGPEDLNYGRIQQRARRYKIIPMKGCKMVDAL